MIPSENQQHSPESFASPLPVPRCSRARLGRAGVLGAAGMVLALLGACSVTPHQAAMVAYDFGPGWVDPGALLSPASTPASRLPATAPPPWARLGLVVKMPAGEDNDDIEYRLAYDDPRVVHRYAEARWLQPPAKLLALRLQQRLGMTEPLQTRSGRCVLTLRIDEFAQIFTQPQTSHARLTGRATLQGPRRQFLAGNTFTLVSADAGPGSARGVAALVALAGRQGDELDVWLHGLRQAGKLKICEED